MVEAVEAKKAGNFTYGMVGGAINMGGSARITAGCFSQN